MHHGTAEVVQWSKSTSGKILQGCMSGRLTLGFATHLILQVLMQKKPRKQHQQDSNTETVLIWK